MAIRLARKSKLTPENPNTSNVLDESNNPTPSTKGFNVSGNPNTNYNLDEISELRNRQSTSAPLITKVNEKKEDDENIGGISVSKEQKNINADINDYKKYLLSCEPSTSGNIPTISLRRPVIIWENGTQDTRSQENVYSIYTEIDSIKKQLENIKITKSIDSANGDDIPTSSAVIEYIEKR